MSLTLLYRGKNVRFSVKLAKHHWLLSLCLFGMLSGAFFYLIFSQHDLPALPVIEQVKQSPVAANLPQEDERVVALTAKVAELQSQLLRLNALGVRLAEQADIPEDEFSLEQPVPAGGPWLGSDFSATLSLDDMTTQITKLTEQLEQQEKQLTMLESLSLGHHIEQSSYLSGRPIQRGWLSSYFGIRKDPFNGRPTMHKGIDFAGKEEANIYATASGVVSWAGERYGYGQLIEVNHGNGLKTRYGHNKTLLVQVGDVVTKGQAIAKMGSTGRSTGPHVHYEILRNDKQINPLKYVYRQAK